MCTTTSPVTNKQSQGQPGSHSNRGLHGKWANRGGSEDA